MVVEDSVYHRSPVASANEVSANEVIAKRHSNDANITSKSLLHYSSDYILSCNCNCKAHNSLKVARACKDCSVVTIWYKELSELESISSLFTDSAISRMLCFQNLTIATILEVFDLSANQHNAVDLELLIYKRQNEYLFNIVCDRTGELISLFPLRGGGKKRKGRGIGRRLKKSIVENVNDSLDDNVDDNDNDLHTGVDASAKDESSLRHVLSQAKYESSDKGIAAKAKYDSSDKRIAVKAKYSRTEKGKKKQAKALATYTGTKKGIKALAKALATYSETKKGREAQAKALATYSETKKGREAQAKAVATYTLTKKGCEALAKALAKYSGTEQGKAAQAKALSTYKITKKGRKALAKAIAKYAGTEKGKTAKASYLETEKGKKAQAKRQAKYKKFEHVKRMCRKRMRKHRTEAAIAMDFSGAAIPGNTRILKIHEVRPEILQKFNFLPLHKSQIIAGRNSWCAPRLVAAGRNNRQGLYKFFVGKSIKNSLEQLVIDRSSFSTAGITKKMLKRKHLDVLGIAAGKLAELTYVKREQCVTVLKMLSNRITSFAEGVLSTVDVQSKQKDKKTALLGLKCHRKGSEPFLKAPSYFNGSGYNYPSKEENKEETDCKKAKSESVLNECDNNCIPLNNNEIKAFEELLKKSAALEVQHFRKFLQNYHSCTKYRDYSIPEKKDLNPYRIYMFPVKHRNHPEECYIPLPGKVYPIEYKGCNSFQVLVRKAMVHWEHGRKVHELISKAWTVHKLLCDIDASTVLGDAEYLSKLMKMKLDFGACVGFEATSEARNITEQSIKQKLSEPIPCKSKKKPTYGEIFDNKCSDLPRNACCCCNVLCAPSKSSKLNINRTNSKLYFDAERNRRPNAAYQQLHDFLVEKGLVNNAHGCESNEESDSENGDTESHPTKSLDKKTLCNSCRTLLTKNIIPVTSLVNKMHTGQCPQVIKELNPIELMFVSKVKCFQTLIKPGPISSKLPDSERLNAVKGNFIHLPLSLAATIAQLRDPNDTNLFDVESFVHCYCLPKKNKTVWRNLVDRKKVFDALTWLVANNANYNDIDLPEKPEDILPDVFGEDEEAYKCVWCEKDSFTNTQELESHKHECAKNVVDCPSSMHSLHDECTTDADTKIGDNPSSSEKGKIYRYQCNLCQQTEFSCKQEFELHEQQCMQNNIMCDDIDMEDENPLSTSSLSDEDNESAGSGENAEANDESKPEESKPWIKKMTKEELDTEFGHFTMLNVNEESKDAKELFKMLKVDSNPVPTYAENLDCLAFPNRFPYGEGGRTDTLRPRKINGAAFEKAHIMTSDGFARRNRQYLFFLAQQREIRSIKEGLFRVTNSKQNQNMTKENILNGAKEEDPALLKQLSGVLKTLSTQNAFWQDVKNKVDAMVFEYGPPTFWATFSPGDYNDADLHKYLCEMNKDLPNVESMTTSQLITLDPVLAATYLQNKFDALLDYILSDAQPIGKVSHYFVRTEYQTRLMAHYHCVFWIEDAPIIGVDSEESILDYIGKHISCKLPSPDDDPILHNLVKSYQYHRCNSYCLRRSKKGQGKARCKFSYPRKCTQKPVLHSVLSSIVSQQSRSYQRRLYELARRQSETRINDYSPILLYLWKGNVDMQYIGENSECLVDYICKYATKGPKSAMDEFVIQHMVEKSDYSKLMSLAMKMLQSREMGAIEARNFVLAENPIKMDARFQFLNAVFPYKRKRMLKNPAQLKQLPDGSTDIWNGDWISSWYPNRPESLKDLSLYQFAKSYDRASNSMVKNMKDKSKLITLRNEQGCVKLRSLLHPVIVHGPNIDPIERPEEFYYSHLLLHKPWVDESQLKGDSETYEAEFMVAKETIPFLAQYVEKLLKKRNMKHRMRADVDSQLSEEERANAARQEVEESSEQNGSDMFDTLRKQTAIETEEQLDREVAGLSQDQRRVYDRFVENAQHYYKHQRKPMLCSCGQFEPLLLFVSGFGGSGKSHLIRVLMGYQYVKSEIKKEPCHFLLGAPTGMASCNICGMTLHSMWRLPVEHGNNVQYMRLNSGVLSKMQGNYHCACGHIIDEVSMISNRMLMYISMRMSDVKGTKDSLFGDMPMIMFGDLFQLEPVRGSPAFIPLKPEQAARLTGGVPCVPDLWKLFEFDHLTTNHRQGGTENARWREVLSRVRFGMLNSSDVQYLNERLINTAGCKKQSDYLAAYVTQFLECEEQGLNPVCLLPKRSMCDEYNRAIMARKGELPMRVEAMDEIVCPKKQTEMVKKKVSQLDERDSAGLEPSLNCALKTRVMLRVNDPKTAGMVNGARGTVVDIVCDVTGKIVSKIMVKFDNIEEVQCVERVRRMFKVAPHCFVYRRMFPLINAYAMTIHKSQSLSLECVFADLGKEIFAAGMSYVALSRCMTHKGLYLMNFNPKMVRASRNACIEYARLLNLKGSEGHTFNKGVASEGLERPWYTSYVQRFATNATASDIKKVKGKRKAAAPINSPAAKKSKGNPTGPWSKQSKTSRTTKCPKDPVTISAPPKRKVPPKAKAPAKGKERPTQSSKGGDTGEVTVTVPSIQTINYIPTDERWQQTVCTAFGWPFEKISRPPTVTDQTGVDMYSKPINNVKIGIGRRPGDCWYQTISHIVTGDEKHFGMIKNAVLHYMEINIASMQQVFMANPYYQNINTDYGIGWGNDYTRKLIEYHRRPQTWADNVIQEMTCSMLKIDRHLYSNRSWGCGYRDFSPAKLWHDHSMIPIAHIEETSQQFLYIYWKNRNHFEPLHSGLQV